MIRFVNAKINLGLNILRKREDGYHELETVFYPIGLYNGTPENPVPFGDILEIHLYPEPGEDEFIFTGNHIDCPPERNLVCKAIGAFREALRSKGKECGHFSVSLDKHIPDGAGLGGGSADASFTLSAANELSGLPLAKDELIETAALLGADCPFFIENSPVLATGIGERMTPVNLNLEGKWAVVVKPDVYVSTREAFSGIKPEIPERGITGIIHSPVEEWEAMGLKNDFEPHIFRLHPALEGIKRKLYHSGALYAAMSGSGSSLFGIFASRGSASEALYGFPTCKTFLIRL